MNQKRNIKITLEYDGTNYSGWLDQKDCITVQSVVTKAVYDLTGQAVEINGCSRTDKGVHAVGYVISFIDSSSIPIEKYVVALNSFLPQDIRAKEAIGVSLDFHATFSKSNKTYRYYFYSSTTQVPLLNNRAWYIGDRNGCDVQAIATALDVMTGEHDFSSFRAMGGMSKTTVRTIYSINFTCENFYNVKMYCLEVTGNGFLYNMVRIIAGTVAEFVKGRMDPNNLTKVLNSGRRELAGPTAPACGLYLWKVDYLSSQN